MPKIWNDVVIYDFHDEIDDSQLLTSKFNSTGNTVMKKQYVI